MHGTDEAAAVAMEEAEGVIANDVRVLPGPIWPPSCTLCGDGLSIGYEGQPCTFDSLRNWSKVRPRGAMKSGFPVTLS